MKRKETIKSISIGAIYVAFYGIIAIISRYLITGVDSLLYYLYPLPIALFAASSKLKLVIPVFISSVLISFLFANPIYVLMLFIPNLLIGLLLGLFEVKSKNKIVNYLIVYIFCVGANFLSIRIYEQLMGVGYFDDIIQIVNTLFAHVSNVSIIVERVVRVVSVVVILIDSLIKEVLIYLLFIILIVRLKLSKDYVPVKKIPIYYNPLIATTYLIVTSIFLGSCYMFLMYDILVWQIIYVITCFIFFVSVLYALFQYSIYIRLVTFRNKTALGIIFIIIGVFLLPITFIFNIVLNFVSRNWYDTIKDTKVNKIV